jgi:nucleoside-diphosphate-sugar epimerase
MKVFLAGGTGVVGTRALPALVAAGHDVTAVARGDAKAALVERLGGTPVSVDLFDAAALAEAVVGHEVVVNLATAIPSLSTASLPRAGAMNDRIRTEASANLVAAALAAGAGRYVQESICFPYLDAGDAWIDEDSPVDRETSIFRAPAVAEAATARFAAEGGAGVVLRFAQFYAADAGHTVTMNRLARRRLSPFIGEATAYMSSIHAEDAGSAVAAALAAPSGTYNVVDDEPVTRMEADGIVAERLGVKPLRRMPKLLLRLNPSTKAVARSQRVGHDRLTTATGWTPAHPSIRTSWPVPAEVAS